MPGGARRRRIDRSARLRTLPAGRRPLNGGGVARGGDAAWHGHPRRIIDAPAGRSTAATADRSATKLYDAARDCFIAYPPLLSTIIIVPASARSSSGQGSVGQLFFADLFPYSTRRSYRRPARRFAPRESRDD